MHPSVARARRGEAGFTLVEALAAMVILTFGIMAVTNLLLIAGSSNTVANRSTAVTMAASQQLETLKNLTWNTVGAGGLPRPAAGAKLGDITVDTPGFFADLHVSPTPVQSVPVHVRWEIRGIDQFTVYLRVRAEAIGRLGVRTRAEFTTFRVCSTPGVGTC